MTPRSLTPSEISSFQQEGYLIVPDVFDPADLEPIRQELHREINRKARELQAEGRLSDLHEDLDLDHQISAIRKDSEEAGRALLKHLIGDNGGGYFSPAVFDLIVNPKLMAPVASLLGSEELITSTYRIRPKLPNLGSGNVPWHQDGGYLSSHCDQELIITCWVPLVDATQENGCMEILPRTHQERIIKHHAGGNADFLVIRDEDLPDDPSKAITATCPRGGVVFMTSRTPHCSTPNTSDVIRWSLDLRYKSTETPNNAGVEPAYVDSQGEADPDFYEKVNVACYPPEPEFLVMSRQHPEKVIDHDEYMRLRVLFANTKPTTKDVRPWPSLAST